MSHDKRHQPQWQPHALSFSDSLRLFLTPAIWKLACQSRKSLKKHSRWAVQPLLLTLLTMTWCCGDSQAERFETARGFAIVCLPKRRRPGKSVQGFERTLAKLPMCVLRIVATGVRQRILMLLDLSSEGFIAFGCDGSSMETPRVEELERRLDPVLKEEARPQVWVTALVHLRTGVLWAWRLGKGYSRERAHLKALLVTLPTAALIVADAGFNGYELAQAITQSGASFLIRMSGKDRLYVTETVRMHKFKEGEVFLWNQEAQRAGQPPLKVRLIRIEGTDGRRDMWLLTNVLDSKRLTVEMASRYYRWRWENEGFFRTYKRTMDKVRLMSRTVRLVHREAEAALLATQLLLAQGALVVPAGKSTTQPERCSARKLLLAVRAVIAGKIGIGDKKAFHQRMKEAVREKRQRKSSKVKRRWVARGNHKPLKPPRFLMMTEKQKALADKLLGAAA